MKLLVDLKLEVEVPEEYHDCEQASTKQWLWYERKAELLGAMKLSEIVSPHAPMIRNVSQRLHLLDTISNVQRQYLQKEKANDVFGGLLDSLLDLMESEYGFIGEIKYEPDGTMYLQTHAITNIAWNDETRALYEANSENGLQVHNLNSLFGKVMTTNGVVISNNPKDDSRACGLPKGHPPLNHFLGVPFFDRNKDMVGVVGIANKSGGYTQEDVDFLEPFMVTCSNLLEAYKSIEEKKRLINSLEEKVAERTRELSLANKGLADANRKVLAASAAQLTHFACMSHEIRTPLNCIIGMSSLLEETPLSDKQKESLRMIITSGELLCAVVNDILDYSKLQSGNVVVEIHRSNLQETLDLVVKSLEHKAHNKQLDFKTIYSPLVPEYIDTDSNRLQQILYNLLGNAIKFSHDGSSVELAVDLISPEAVSTTSSEEATQCDVERPVASSSKCPFQKSSCGESPVSDSGSSSGAPYPPGCPFAPSHLAQTQAQLQSDAIAAPAFPHCQGVLRFSVKDYGRGIDEKDFDRIFEPFGQASDDTERLYGGTGLGLAITANLVERLGGKISVDSELGKWSKFTVDIPANDDSRPDMSAYMHRLMDSRILYVDKPNECNDQVIYNLDLPVERFDSCQEMYDWFMEEAKTDHCSSKSFHFCLVHEDMYSPEVYAKLAETTTSALVTFGPQHSIAVSRAHFRSISELIPCVLLRSLVALRIENGNTILRVQRPSGDDIFQRVDVLIAEDNVVNQKVLCKMLKRLGVECIDIANNGLEAVEMSAAKHYDIVFMDIQMPIMCGDEACRIICDRYKGRDSRPKIAFLSAHVSSAYTTMAIDAGGDGFLSKPFNIKKFETFIRSLEP